MDMEENLDEIFDLKPILPEFYSSQSFSNSISKLPQQPQPSDHHARRTANAGQQMISSTPWNSCYIPQEIITTKPPPPPPPPSAAVVASTSQLVSFENSIKNTSYLPTNSDTAYNSNLDHEMADDYSLTPQIISFSSLGNNDDSGNYNQYHDAAIDGMLSHKRVCASSRTPLQAQDHLMAERKRREKIGQLFISLSKVVPGLKKLDKASLLEDAINYLKALQERVNILEDQEELIKKSSIEATSKDHEQETSIDNDNVGSTSELAAPEIKARISDSHVLIKIWCKKQMSLMSRIPCEMEKMNISVVDMRVMPFGGTALDITILAEMQSEFRGSVKDIVDHLQTAFLNPRTDNMQQDDQYLP